MMKGDISVIRAEMDVCMPNDFVRFYQVILGMFSF